MSELRLNIITNEWVIMSGDKSPKDFAIREKRKLPEFSENCPFCPGHEVYTPSEIYKIRDDKGWRIRVVNNKYPVLSKETQKIRKEEGLKKSITGAGIHEVIIESPIHNHTTAIMPLVQLKDVLQTYKERFLTLYSNTIVEHVIIFKNQGHASGTKIQHPFSEIVGLPIFPLTTRNRMMRAINFFDNTGECIFCKTLQDELSDGKRIILETEHFVSFIPFASLSPFHIWIFPKRHSGAFSSIKENEMWDLAYNLKFTMAKLYYGLENPDFNYVLRSGKPVEDNLEYLHWYISIVPRVAQASGFELGTGIYRNPLLPEVAAEFLREIKEG
ncbi:MAG: galactose-1-phosphate uridylyltransferase [Thermodesulfovibrio sp.]|nr:galactose-1-phosphate uridylyltransferase [Thermodesulfovibrio sp.]MDW7999014.1 galactose-1-phosphate uridylyltransferase [Thermodesulfovibrio sp.]